MANNTIYPYGTNGELPSSIGIIDDHITGGVDKALSAEEGKRFGQELYRYEKIDIPLGSWTGRRAYLSDGSIETLGTSLSNTKISSIDVSEFVGKTIFIDVATTRYGTSIYKCLFTDSSDNVIEYWDEPMWTDSTMTTECEPTQKTIPTGTKYLKLTNFFTWVSGSPEIKTNPEVYYNLEYDAKIDYDDLFTDSYETLSPKLLFIIDGNGKWQDTGVSSQGCCIIPIQSDDSYLITTNNTAYHFIAWLTDNSHVHHTNASFSSSYEGRIELEPSSEYRLIAPSDAQYLYVLLVSSVGDTGTTVKHIGTSAVVERIKEIAGTQPQSDNSISPITLRSRQMSQIKWEIVGNITMNTGDSSVVQKSAGTSFTGMPYSSTKEIDKYIGFDVSIHTFMTAVNNPYSLFYTECINGSHSSSAWGKTYHGVNCATYFGVVCNVFAHYCNDATIPFNTAEHAWMNTHKGNFARIQDQSSQGLLVGDIVWSSGHDRCVTSITRDNSGAVTNIVISESVHVVVSSTSMTANEFDSYISTNKCIIYRYNGIIPKYIPSPFVSANYEIIEEYTYNNDICTFAGDKASFKVGDTIAVNYNLKSVGAWTKMYLYKGEIGNRTQVKEITLDSSEHIVDLTNENLTYGLYAARLYDGTAYSDYTYFEVVDGSVAATENNNITRITFSSSNGKPLYYEVCAESGATYAINSLSDFDRENGFVDVNLTKLNQEQYPNKPFSGTMYIKVHFNGQYGRVAYKISTL